MNIRKEYCILATILLFAFSSCNDLLESDSSSFTIDNGEMMDSPNDSLYSVMGILSQVQKLGERYVLLGELRGDLMTATSDADVDLQQLSHFNVDEENRYTLRRDYYNVINNCNYALERMDTSIVVFQDKVMIPEYAAIKGIRAWTYWQMALAFGSVNWIEKPILDLEESIVDYPAMECDALAEKLIDDLKPFVDARCLDYGMIDGYQSVQMFIPVQLLLGDLYLYLNRYEEAASMFHSYIYKNRLTITKNYANNYMMNTRQDVNINHNASYVDEMLSGFVYNSDAKEYHPQLIRLSYNTLPSVVPSANFTKAMERSMHFYSEAGALIISAYFEGDLRGNIKTSTGVEHPVAYGTFAIGSADKNTYITKYSQAVDTLNGAYDPQNDAFKNKLVYTRAIPLYRVPHVYLRYAEAVNRLGKPSLAFAVLKYGLTAENLADAEKVNPAELVDFAYADFNWLHNSDANANVGTASRGRGRGISLDKENYIIPDFTQYVSSLDEESGEEVLVPSTDALHLADALSDSIAFVEECIVDELAAETAFEGNRFFDLLRISRHRGEFPAYMAKKVSLRFSDAETMRQHLMEPSAWYIK